MSDGEGADPQPEVQQEPIRLKSLPQGLDISAARSNWTRFSDVPDIEHVILGLLNLPDSAVTWRRVPRPPGVLHAVGGIVDGRPYFMIGYRTEPEGSGKKRWVNVTFVAPGEMTAEGEADDELWS